MIIRNSITLLMIVNYDSSINESSINESIINESTNSNKNNRDINNHVLVELWNNN